MTSSLGVALGLLVFLALLKPLHADIAFLVAFVYQLYVPRYFGYEFVFDRTVIKQDLIRSLLLAAAVFPIYALVYFGLQPGAVFKASLDPGLLWSLVVNVFLIALPEEFFYRGFLQSRFISLFEKWGFKGILVAILAVNILFALGHFVGEYHPARLLPFFPGLLFAWLSYKGRGSLVGAITFHGLCNVFSEWLAASLHWIA